MNRQMMDVFNMPRPLAGFPLRELTEMGLKHAQRVAGLQFETGRDYLNLTLEQTRAVLDCRSPDDLQMLFNGQQKYLQFIGQRLGEDAQTLANMNRDYAEATFDLIRTGAAAENAAPPAEARRTPRPKAKAADAAESVAPEPAAPKTVTPEAEAPRPNAAASADTSESGSDRVAGKAAVSGPGANTTTAASQTGTPAKRKAATKPSPQPPSRRASGKTSGKAST